MINCNIFFRVQLSRYGIDHFSALFPHDCSVLLTLKQRNRTMSNTRYTTPQAAEHLNQTGLSVAASTLEHYRSKGTGPVYLRIAGRIFYTRSALDDFASGTVVYPTAHTSAVSEGGAE